MVLYSSSFIYFLSFNNFIDDKVVDAAVDAAAEEEDDEIPVAALAACFSDSLCFCFSIDSLSSSFTLSTRYVGIFKPIIFSIWVFAE